MVVHNGTFNLILIILWLFIICTRTNRAYNNFVVVEFSNEKNIYAELRHCVELHICSLDTVNVVSSSFFVMRTKKSVISSIMWIRKRYKNTFAISSTLLYANFKNKWLFLTIFYVNYITLKFGDLIIDQNYFRIFSFVFKNNFTMNETFH